MIDANEFKNIKVLFNKCNLNISKVALKGFIDGIKIVNKFKKYFYKNKDQIKTRRN